jgi:cob(I)alamin adenosyltransferase
MVFTGNGKGKTTAALGTVLRAAGHGLKILVLQFIKGTWKYGELESLNKLGVKIETLGRGFTWKQDDLKEDVKLAQSGWEKAKEAIFSGEYDLIVLDELSYVLSYEFLAVEDVVQVLKTKPESLHLIITGRDAPQEMMEAADLVTEMKMIKHPYHTRGIKAQRGIEF